MAGTKRTGNPGTPKRSPAKRSARNSAIPYRSKSFDYSLDYSRLDLRRSPHLYKVGRGEQGVLLVEPYKSEILPHWRFATPVVARRSALRIYKMFKQYKRSGDFVGMDMARKFIQMGYTRSRRYANHRSGRKYNAEGKVLPRDSDKVKARSASEFARYLEKIQSDAEYLALKADWKRRIG